MAAPPPSSPPAGPPAGQTGGQTPGGITRDPRFRIVRVTLDDSLPAPRSPEAAHERRVAIHDLLEDNHFRPVEAPPGPYDVNLRLAPQKLFLEVQGEAGAPVATLPLGTLPFRRIARDYQLVCESYYDAIRSAAPSRIETLDMGRRGLHDEGATLLRERLAPAAEIDHATARRLFTLFCALAGRG